MTFKFTSQWLVWKYRYIPVSCLIRAKSRLACSYHKQLAGDFRSLVRRLGKLGNVLQQDKGLVEV